MSIKDGLKYMAENDLSKMKKAFESILSEKAVNKLEEKKILIAKNYFGKDKK